MSFSLRRPASPLCLLPRFPHRCFPRLAFLLLVCLGLAGGTTPAAAAEFFVNRGGNDRNSGTTRSEAFATVQKGLDALDPGDTLHIGPGEYREAVSRTGLGRPGVTTTIRADIEGTALLCGKVPVTPEEGFRKEEGYRFVYSAPFEGELQGLIEEDTMTALQVVASPDLPEYQPGSYFFDPSQKRVFFSSTDLMPPIRHRYGASVVSRSGLELIDPVGVVIEGIAVSGFQEGARKARHSSRIAGIKLDNPVGCRVERCITFLNSNGIVLFKGSDNLVYRCESYGNGGTFGGEGGNIIRFHGARDVISDCIAYRSSLAGIRFYLNPEGPVLLKRNIAWGNLAGDFWIKGGKGASQYGKMEHSIAFGKAHVFNLTQSLVSGRNNYQPDMAKDNLTVPVSRYEQHFADPRHLDFRLQADSSLKKQGLEVAANTGAVFYVSQKGNDQADGQSVRQAWQTLDRALASLKAGDTLYLLEGSYRPETPLTLKGDRGQPINIRARSRERVIIETPMVVENGEWLNFERLVFTRSLRLSGGTAIRINQCRFDNDDISLFAANTGTLTVSHSEFTTSGPGGIRLEDAPPASVTLTGNLFRQQSGPSIGVASAGSVRYSDYNGYAHPTACWQVAGEPWGFPRLQSEQEPHSVLLPPQGTPAGQGDAAFLSAGPLGKPLGRFDLMEHAPVRTAGPFLHSVSDTTANVEWWTSEAAECRIAWGTTPDCSNEETCRAEGFGRFSLTGLKPGQRYYFKLLSAKPATRPPLPSPAEPLMISDPPLVITTAKEAAAPVTYHVAPDGDDRNDGLHRKRAWRRVAHAADKAGPGDTVLISGGTYEELVYLRRTGEAGRPITFRAAPGEEVVFSGGNRGQGEAFSVQGKSHLRFDGFYFRQFSYGAANLPRFIGKNAAFLLYNGRDIRVERCFNDGRRTGAAAGLVSATDIDGLIVRNCVMANGWFGMEAHQCDRTLVEHNVFLRNLILAISVVSPPDKKVVFRKNIVTDSLKIKARTQLIESANFASLEEAENLYHLRLTDEEKRMFFVHKPEVERYTFAQAMKLRGNHGSILSDSMLAGAARLVSNGKGDDFPPDLLVTAKDLDFPDLFSTHPKAAKEGIGLQIKAFKDFHFNKGIEPVHGPQAANRVDNRKRPKER